MPPSRNSNRDNARRPYNQQDGKSSDTMAAVAAIGVIAFLVLGGFYWFSHRSSGPKLTLLVGADVTGSMGKAGRQQYFGILDETVNGVLPKGTPVKLWSFDVNAHKVADITPRKAEDLWSDEDNIIKLHTNTPGTLPAVVLLDMMSSIEDAHSKNEGVALMLLTDGEDQDPKQTEKVCKQLAGMSNLKALWVTGASTENGFRSSLERRLTPILGDRLVVSSGSDARDALNRFRGLIEK